MFGAEKDPGTSRSRYLRSVLFLASQTAQKEKGKKKELLNPMEVLPKLLLQNISKSTKLSPSRRQETPLICKAGGAFSGKEPSCSRGPASAAPEIWMELLLLPLGGKLENLRCWCVRWVGVVFWMI